MKFKRSFGPEPNYKRVLDYKRPDNKLIVIAGPCFAENKDLIWSLAKQAADIGATHFRGGVFRAGTYPPDNFGLVGEDIFREHQSAAHFYGLINIMEVLDYSNKYLDIFNKYADCLQIGARQMQNYTLLKKVAELGKPVFLKRGVGSTIDELLGSAEYLLKFGNGNVNPTLIERGSAGIANHVRWDLSISMIPAVKAITDIPIIVDASHGTGRADLVEPMTLAGIAAGADGFLCEIHDDPKNSLSDSEQAIKPIDFQNILNKVYKIKEII